MIRIIILLTVYIILFFPIFGATSEDVDAVLKVTNEFLEAEFNGDQMFRVENVLNSPERKRLIKKNYNPLIGEIFYWESEILCVVDKFEITKAKVIHLKAKVDVIFQEFACTGSKGYGFAPLIKTDKKSLTTYNLEYNKGRWWVYEPPIPRISRKALIEYINPAILRMKDSENQKGYYNVLVNTIDMLQGK